MNRLRKSTPGIPILLAGLVFVTFLVLAIVFQETLKEVVLVPLLYLLWLGNFILKSFDQRCIWLLALIITVLTSLSISRPKQKTQKTNLASPKRRDLSAGRIQFWQGQIRVSSSTVYTRTYRRSELRQLTFKVLAYQENCSIEEVRARLRTGQLQVPTEVRYVLGLEIPEDDQTPKQNFFERLSDKFDQYLEKFFSPGFSPDPRLVKTAEYLENRMEKEL
jgi:hypothetical protein